MATVVATTTWNSIDLIEPFLSHYRKLGFDQSLVMDFGSTDGTQDVLASGEWKGFVERVPFPGIARLDSSNIMLSSARQAYGSGGWCLFCDPDERLVTPSMRIHEAALDAVREDAEAMSIPRFNATAPLSVARLDEGRLSPADALTLRIDRRRVKSADETIRTDRLDPPWVFTAILPKVFVRLDCAVAVGEGDHSVRTAHDRATAAPAGVYLLHYPFRGYSLFRDKVELARLGYQSNPHLSPSYGWQVRRWIKLADAEKLYEEYVQQFIPDEDVERLIGDGTLSRDESVRSFTVTHSEGSSY